MGLEAFKQQDTTKVDLIHPATGEEIGMSITIYGTQSQQYRAEERRQQQARIKRIQKTGKHTVDMDTIDADALSLAVSCVKSWENVDENGSPLECNEDNIRRVFTKFPEIQKQVTEALHDNSRFFLN